MELHAVLFTCSHAAKELLRYLHVPFICLRLLLWSLTAKPDVCVHGNLRKGAGSQWEGREDHMRTLPMTTLADYRDKRHGWHPWSRRLQRETAVFPWDTLPNPQAADALGHLNPKLYNQNYTLQVCLGFLSHINPELWDLFNWYLFPWKCYWCLNSWLHGFAYTSEGWRKTQIRGIQLPIYQTRLTMILKLFSVSLPPSCTVPDTWRHILWSTILPLFAPLELLRRMESR